MSISRVDGAKRLIPLEAYRGIAAVIVVLHHFFLAFSPFTTGVLKETRSSDSLIGVPYFVVLNGAAAVSFFFVLSGFVLCWSFFLQSDNDKLLLAFVKRWPRLAGPVVLTTLLSYLLFKTDLYAFAGAAVFSQSPWLATFARAGWTPDFHASFASALAQGLLTFFTGQTKYNTNLWTMKYEFVGSVFVFITAAFIVHVLRYRFLLLAFLMLIAILSPLSPRVAPFVFGVFLAAHLSRNQHAMHGVATFWVWVIAGLYCLGYVESVGAYSWLAPVSGGSVENAQILLHTLGSVLIIYATMRCRSAFAVMSRPFGAWLGRLSFPVYLVHTLVICSIGSSAFAYGHEHGFSPRLASGVAFVATALGTLALAVPLMLFDEWWMKRVDQGVRALIRM